MKSLPLLFLLLPVLISISANAQDIIVLKNGDEVKAKVTEVSVNEVKYKKYSNLDGPSYTELKANVFMIKYQNGTNDVFNTSPVSAPTPAPVVINRDEEKKNSALVVLEKYFSNLFKSTAPYKYISYKKVNGVLLNVNGQSIYQIDFDFTIQVLRDIWLKGNSQTGFWSTRFSYYDTKPDLYASGERFVYETKLIPARSVFTFGCTAKFTDSDNGYVFSNYDIKTITDRGVQLLQNPVKVSPPPPPPPPIVNEAVDFSKFKGLFFYDNKNYAIKIADIKIEDELNNISEFQKKTLEVFSATNRLSNSTLTDANESVELIVKAKVAYKEMIRNDAPTYFSSAVLSISLITTKEKSVLYTNSYSISNYSILSKGFPTKIQANRDLISYYIKDPIHQFIIGNFPIKGEIVEITEKNKKGDEAKFVKINRGSNDGVNQGYEFIIDEPNVENSKGDLTVKSVFADYALCKVNNNEKKIIELLSLGKIY